MKLKEFDILLDIKKNRNVEEFEVVQGDYQTNILNVTLMEGLNEYDLSGLNIEIAFAKSDGTTVLQDKNNGVTLIGNKIICTLKTNTIASPGKVLTEVRVLEGTKLLTSSRFSFFVRQSIVNDETIESTDEFPILNGLITDVADLIEEIQSKPTIRGYSAYQVWLNEGNIGTVDDYLSSLIGPQGKPGLQGKPGIQGERGPTGSIENLDKGNIEDALGYTPFNPVDIANNLTTTVVGKALDARQGKVIGDELENTKGSVSSQSGIAAITNQHLRQVNVSTNSIASGVRSQVNTSNGSTASDIRSQINCSDNCVTAKNGSQINCSTNTISAELNASVWGYGSGEPSTQNRTVEIKSFGGTIKASGAITGNSSFADFAEYFESENGKSIQLGTIVSLAPDGKIKIANQGEYMVGVISQTAGVILNAQGFEWKDRYLYDRYGQPILVDKEVMNEETGEIETVKTQMLNINYKEDEVYIGREDREEWNVVGLTGQIFVNVDDTVREGDFIQVRESGIGTKGRNEYGQNWQVMKVTTEYEEELGFGIALVFVR